MVIFSVCKMSPKSRLNQTHYSHADKKDNKISGAKKIKGGGRGWAGGVWWGTPCGNTRLEYKKNLDSYNQKPSLHLTKNNTEILKNLNLNDYFFQNLTFKKLSLHKSENIVLFYWIKHPTSWIIFSFLRIEISWKMSKKRGLLKSKSPKSPV